MQADRIAESTATMGSCDVLSWQAKFIPFLGDRKRAA
jgi:hypothetical protein